MTDHPLAIIYEDDALLVINKPSGITVNRSETTLNETTVQDLIIDYLHFPPPTQAVVKDDEDSDTIASAFRDRAGIAHRLDKETSGILLIGKTEASFTRLLEEFKERIVSKTYVTLVHGRVAPQEGEINVPVGRLPWNRRQFGIVAGGRESLTKYTVKGYFRTNDKRKEQLSYVEARPLTGRTHQIRVHMQYLGHPIFSDFLYAGRKTKQQDRLLLARVFLHAASISFLHPTTGEKVTFEAPLPKELAAVFDHLVPMV